ncbi:hypothetical protein BOX15_Mlig000932g1, partial [Macrostomum lignano]
SSSLSHMANVNSISLLGARIARLMQDEAREIAALPADTAAFKNSELPLARIKKIMKLDDDVRGMMIAAEAPLLFSKAAELLIKELTLRAWSHTERQRRRTLQRIDISASVYDQDTDQFDFLIDIVPREEPQQLPATPARSASAPAAASAAAPAPVSAASAAAATGHASLTAELMEHQTPAQPAAVTVVTSSHQPQQQVQYVIQMPGGQQQPMQLAFVSSQDHPAGGHQQPVLHFATAAAASDVQQEALDVKPDIAQLGLSGPVPISFAGL